MTEPAGPVPVEEVSACARACAQWLFDKGFTTLPKDATVDPTDFGFNIDNSKVYGPPPNLQARAVLEVFYWLWRSALPAIDGRRAKAYEKAAKGPPQGGPYQVLDKKIAPADFADLIFGATEHELARNIDKKVARISRLEKSVERLAKQQTVEHALAHKIRGAVTQISALQEFIEQIAERQTIADHALAREIHDAIAQIATFKKSVEQVADRQTRRVALKGDASGDVIRAALKTFVDAGQTLQNLIEPTGAGGIEAMLVPHTKRDWSRCRLELELHLHTSYCTDRQIVRLLPGAGSEKTVKQRRRRVRRSHLPKGAHLDDSNCDADDDVPGSPGRVATGSMLTEPWAIGTKVPLSKSCALAIVEALRCYFVQNLTLGHPR